MGVVSHSIGRQSLKDGFYDLFLRVDIFEAQGFARPKQSSQVFVERHDSAIIHCTRRKAMLDLVH